MRWVARLAGSLLWSGVAFASADAALPIDPGEQAAERAHADVHYPWLADLADDLARSSNPRHLMVAARLATQFWFDKETVLSPEVRAALEARPQLDAGTLVEKALRLGATDPLIWWIAANDCPAAPPRCDRRAAIAHLQSLAPSNAAVWILSDRPRRPTDRESVDAALDAQDDLHLDHIAAASRFDIYLGEALRSYMDALSRLPLPQRSALTDAAFDAPPSDDVVRGMLAFGYTMAEALPRLSYFAGLCDADAIARLGAPRRERCLAAMRTAVREADSVLIERLASGVLLRLLPEGPDRDAMLRATARTAWQMESWMALGTTGDPPLTRARFEHERVALWLAPGASELDVMRKQLETAGIALDPPSDWKPSRPFAPLPPPSAD
jgi:hypothetical protein